VLSTLRPENCDRALILSAGDQEITASSFSLLRQGQPCDSRQELCRVAEQVRDDERLLAWLIWVLIYIQFLAEGSLRFSVFFRWVWTYLSAKRGRLEALLAADRRHQLNINM
jgi:hypothetical protein